MRHYEALKVEAAELGLPFRFRTDLTRHDRKALAKLDPSEPFGWCLCADGTHLYLPGATDGVGHTVDQFPGFWANASKGMATNHWYWWDGNKLCTVSRNQLEWLLKSTVEKKVA